MLSAGIDIGSRNTKLVIWDTGKDEIIYKHIMPTGIEPRKTAEDMLTDGLKSITMSKDFIPMFSTGYGRKSIQGSFISEISCHTKGIINMLPQTRTIIDIGGQDSKVISLDEKQNILEFAMNDKCAAGTGSFLEKVADLFQVPVSKLGVLALQAERLTAISSTCVVFAESEIISLLNQHIPQNEILRGVHSSIVMRIKNLLSNISWQRPVTLTGGVALNPAIREYLAVELGAEVTVPLEPLYTGALGAALFAAEREKN